MIRGTYSSGRSSFKRSILDSILQNNSENVDHFFGASELPAGARLYGFTVFPVLVLYPCTFSVRFDLLEPRFASAANGRSKAIVRKMVRSFIGVSGSIMSQISRREVLGLTRSCLFPGLPGIPQHFPELS